MFFLGLSYGHRLSSQTSQDSKGIIRQGKYTFFIYCFLNIYFIDDKLYNNY